MNFLDRTLPDFPARLRPPLRGALLAFCLFGASLCNAARAEVNEWTKGGPYAPGGIGLALAIDPQDANAVYLSTNGGVFRTVNGGQDWAPAGRGLPSGAARLAVDPRSGSTVYAALYSDGVFKTVDRGATWRAVKIGSVATSRTAATALAVDPLTPQTVYAGIGTRGVFKSSDAGESWVQILGSNGEGAAYLSVTEIVVDPADPSTLFVATSSGIYKTVDGGRQWTSQNEGLDLEENGSGGSVVVSLELDAQSPRILYAGTFKGLFKTTNGGGTWSRSDAGLPPGFHPVAIAAHGDSAYTAVYGQGIFRSADAGATWLPANAGLTSLVVSDVEVDPRLPSTVYVAMQLLEEGGIAKTTNGGTNWHRLGGEFQSISAGNIAVDPELPSTFYAATRAGVFRSEDSGGRWTRTSSGLPNDGVGRVTIDPRVPSTLYATGSYSPGFFRSRDRGANWVEANHGIPTNQSVYALTVAATSPTSTIYVGVTYSGVWRSTNEGESWTSLGPTGITISAVLADPLSPLVLYAGTSDGDIFRTSDGGANWTSVYRQALRAVTSIAIDPLDSRVLYAGWSYSGPAPGGFSPPGGVLRSVDGGLTWRELEAGPSRSVGTVVADPRRPRRVYAGGLYDVSRSDDGGETWTPMSNGLPEYSYVSGITIDPQSSYRILAGVSHSDLGGVYEFTLGPDRETPVRPCAIGSCSNRRGARTISDRPTRP